MWPTRTLNNGFSVSGIAYGSSELPLDKTADLVEQAFHVGFRHFDTSPNYENEVEFGEGLRRLNRSEFFLSTKYEGYAYPRGKFNKGPLEELRASLDRLGMDFVDMYLIHSPRWVGDAEANVKAWKEMEECVARGWTRGIGVSNFYVEHLEALLPHTTITPAVNQIPFCPLYYAHESHKAVRAYMANTTIAVEGFSPLARNPNKNGEALSKALNEIIERHGNDVDAPAVLFAWSKAKGVIPVTMTTKEEHMRAALKAGGVQLSEEDVRAIDAASELDHDKEKGDQ